MRAAILTKPDDAPQVGEFDEPPGDAVDVRVAGMNPVDLMLASADSQPTTPSVVGQEGVGTTADGSRVYFQSPPDPFGSWAQRCAVDPEHVFPVPDGVDDDLAVALGIAGLAAWLPLTQHANVTADSNVLVLGATGAVGQIAVQCARLLGAGRVVGAGRDPDALDHVNDLGADAVLRLGQGDDEAALRQAADGGYDIVVDTVYGDPFLAALANTAAGATLITVGLTAGASADIPFSALQGRTHVGHGNNVMPIEVVREAYGELMAHAAEGRLSIETIRYSLEDATEAWNAAGTGPDLKVAVVP